MPRVTRAQAEAAMRSLKWRADAWAGDRACRDDLAMQANERFEATLRAYLAQRPDEDTVYSGCASLAVLHVVALTSPHAIDADLAEHASRVRAAMYQPEEE